MTELNHTDKLSRTQIFNRLLDIKKGVKTLSDYDIDALLNYFAPSVPKKPKDVRFYLRYVYVSGGEIVGCDGRRVHIGKTELEDGFYCPQTRLKVRVDAKYPDIKRTKMDCDTSRKGWIVSVKSVNKKPLHYATVGNCNINKVYLDDAIAKPESIFWDEKNVTGDCEFGVYVIQGMRV